MRSTFLPRKLDKETGMRASILGSVKSGCLCPTFGAYVAAEAGKDVPINIPQVAKARASFRLVDLLVFHYDREGSLDGLRRLDECVGRVAVAITFEEELRADRAFSIQDEGSRFGHARRLAFGGLVTNMVGVDGLAPGVREQGEGDPRAVGKPLEYLRRIVADADDMDP